MECIGPRTFPQETIYRCCAEVAKNLPTNTEIDFSSRVAEPAAKSLTGSWFGLSADDTNWLISAFGLARTSEDPLRRAAAAQLAVAQLRKMIDAAIESPNNTLLSRMAKSWQKNGADRDSLIAFVAPMFDSLARGFGGRLLTHTAYHLTKQMKVQDQIRSDGWAVAREAALESARLDPVNQTILRECLEDRKVAGVHIAKGDRLVIVLPAVCRDPSEHADPDNFSLNRKSRHLAFGHGTYACSGREIALAVATTMLTELIHQTGLSILPSPDRKPVFSDGFGRSCLELPVILDRLVDKRDTSLDKLN
ncbi:cytochrome P450 [Nocardiopsis dassonvillei]|uniref:cytochrome P450 n=1 Tax=Nocardiopsis dassonvillei TaxID=2014 RepID=UPI0036733928